MADAQFHVEKVGKESEILCLHEVYTQNINSECSFYINFFLKITCIEGHKLQKH